MWSSYFTLWFELFTWLENLWFGQFNKSANPFPHHCCYLIVYHILSYWSHRSIIAYKCIWCRSWGVGGCPYSTMFRASIAGLREDDATAVSIALWMQKCRGRSGFQGPPRYIIVRAMKKTIHNIDPYINSYSKPSCNYSVACSVHSVTQNDSQERLTFDDRSALWTCYWNKSNWYKYSVRIFFPICREINSYHAADLQIKVFRVQTTNSIVWHPHIFQAWSHPTITQIS